MNKKYLTKKHILFYAGCLVLFVAIVLTTVFGCLRASAAPVSIGSKRAVSSDGAEFLFISESVVLTDDGGAVDIGALSGEENMNIVWAERRNGMIYAVTESKNVYVTDGDSVVFRGSVTGIPQSLSVSDDGNALAVVMRSSRNYSIGFFDLKNDYYRRIELDCQGQNAFIRKADGGYLIDVVKSDVEFVTYSSEGEKVGRRIIDDIPLASCTDGNAVYILAENNVVYAIDTESFEIKEEIPLGKDHRGIGYIAAEQLLIAVDYSGDLTLIGSEGLFRAKGVYESTGVIVNSGNEILLKTRTGAVYATSLTDVRNRSAYGITFTVFLCLAIAFALACIVLLFVTFERAKTGLIRFGKGVKKHKVPVIVLLPVAVLVGFLSYYPAISGLALSFLDYKPGAYSRFAGISNFVSMFRNEYFWIGFKNLIIFVVAGLIKSLIPPIVVALLIIAAHSKKMQYFFRTALYLPAVLPGVAGLLLWTNGIYGPSGMLNSFVTAFGGTARNWLGNTDTVIWMLILIGFPWVGSFLIFYGAFKGVPDSYHEAAKIEGAGYFKILFGIDIPLIVPQIRYVLIMSLISGVQEFSLVYFTTGGGPGNATYVPMLEIYLQVTKYQNYGVAAAMGVFMFVVLFSITFVNLKLTTKKKEAQY